MPAPGPQGVTRGAHNQAEVEGAVPAEWQPGDRIAGLYDITEVLGRGGMGVVYRARHRQWGIDLAVKSLRPDLLQREDSARAFDRECRTWIQLGLHPHVVSCYYVRQLGGIPRLFAEYVAEGSLATWVKSGRLYQKGLRNTLARVLDVAIQVAWGLQHAHRQGVVHQDVKPSNILMAAPQTAKVTDFGIARAQAAIGGGTDGTVRVAAQGMTPQYASPEQFGRGELTPRSDLWSWALTVVEMFTGEATWLVGEVGRVVLEPFRSGPPVEPRPPLPPALFELLWRCLDPEPAARPESLAAVAAELTAIFAAELGVAYPRVLADQTSEAADNLNNRAVSMLDLGLEREAAAALGQATRQDRFHPEASYNLGLLRWRRGADTDAALVASLEAARSARTGDWLPLYLLAQTHRERGDLRAASEALAAMRTADVRRPEVALLRAEVDEALSAGAEGPLHGARGRLTAAATGPDGRLLAADQRGWLLLWDPATGQLQHRQLNYRPAVALCLAAGGATAWSAHAGGEIQSWVLGNESYCRAIWPAAAGEISRLAVAPGRAGVLVAGGRGTVSQWSSEGRRPVWTARLEDDPPVAALASVLDLVYVVAGQRVLRLAADNGAVVGELTAGPETITALALDGSGQHLLTGGNSGSLRLWATATGECLATLRPTVQPIQQVALSQDGQWAASAESDGAVRWWSVADGRCRRTVIEAGEPVLTLGLTPAGDALVVATGSGATIWRRGTAGASGQPPGMMISRPVTSDRRVAPEVVFAEALRQGQAAAARGEFVAAAEHLARAMDQSGYRDHADALALAAQLRRRLPRGAFRAAWEAHDWGLHEAPVQRLLWDQQRQRALTQANWTELRVTDLATGEALNRVDLPAASGLMLTDHAYGADRQMLGAPGESWELWDLVAGRLLYPLPKVACGAFSPDGRLEVTVRLGLGNQLEFALRELGGRRLRRRAVNLPWREAWAAPPVRLTCDLDLRHMLTDHGAAGCYLWDLVRRARVWTRRATSAEVTSGALLPGGQMVALGGSDGQVEVHAASGQRRWGVSGHQGQVTALQFTVDGRALFSAGDDGTVRLWEVADGQPVQTLRARGGAVGAMAVDPSGYELLVGTADGHVRHWRLDWALTAHQADSQAMGPRLEQLQRTAAAALRTYGARDGQPRGAAADYAAACRQAVGLADS